MIPLLLATALQLVDQCGDTKDSRAAAEIVVTGVIVSDKLVRRPVPMHSDPEVKLQLRRLRLRVENVLLGGPVGKAIGAYYFTYWSGHVGNAPLGMWHTGARRVWWLRRDGDVLRTTCDGIDGCTLEIASGAHLDYRAAPARPLDYAVAELRLTRGTGPVSDIRFATTVAGGDRVEMPESNAIRWLRRLVDTEQGMVREGACERLWIDALDFAEAKDALAAGQCQCSTLPAAHVCHRLDGGGFARRP